MKPDHHPPVTSGRIFRRRRSVWPDRQSSGRRRNAPRSDHHPVFQALAESRPSFPGTIHLFQIPGLVLNFPLRSLLQTGLLRQTVGQPHPLSRTRWYWALTGIHIKTASEPRYHRYFRQTAGRHPDQPNRPAPASDHCPASQAPGGSSVSFPHAALHFPLPLRHMPSRRGVFQDAETPAKAVSKPAAGSFCTNVRLSLISSSTGLVQAFLTMCGTSFSDARTDFKFSNATTPHRPDARPGDRAYAGISIL